MEGVPPDEFIILRNKGLDFGMHNISFIILDVDGTLTDGSIIHSSTGAEIKNFSVKDGLVLKVLPKLGIPVVFLTGRNSTITEKRGKELDVQDVLQGVSDKKSALLAYMAKHSMNADNVAYIGDDLNDYAAMRLCGFKACPADAVAEICDICDYISPFAGGHGAVRDICEFILKREGKHRDFLSMFGVINA